MNNLSNTIYHYYLSHFDELPFDKQFHFASRLYLWSYDPAARDLLAGFRAEFTASDQPALALAQVRTAALETAGHGSKNASQLRQPYFDRYPELKTNVMLLFRTNFMDTLYNVDGRPALTELVDMVAMQQLYEQLQADSDAVAILSTHAVNFMYLYQKLINEATGMPDPELFWQVGQSYYDLANPIHLQLLIYLYTHCIIGESLFYARAIPELHLPIYRRMIEQLEQIIGAQFGAINLDNKCEFLVCCRLVGYESKLASRIYSEAERSVSNNGSFIIDRHNTNPQQANVDSASSEHRNVLLIMSSLPYATRSVSQHIL